jgi:hypothetical protein
MKARLRPIAFGLLVAATAAAFADDPGLPVPPIQTPMAAACPAASWTADAARLFDSTWEMNNGRLMEVVTAGCAVRVKHGRQRSRVLRPDGRGGFVSADRRWLLRPKTDAAGQLGKLRLSLPASVS